MKSSIATLTLPLILLAAACGTPNDPITKSDARGEPLKRWDGDYCALYGWYGDGECDDFCPNADDDCADEDVPCDCGPMPLLAPICDDGSTGGMVCVESSDGTCSYQSDCDGSTDGGTGTACPDHACDGQTAPAMACADGTDAPTACVPDDDGVCTLTVVECPDRPDGDCAADECGPAPAIARVCDDGSTADMVCRRADDGTCGYAHVCECDPAECGPQPLGATYLCEDGSTAGVTGRCVESGDSCGWEILDCPE